SGRDSAVAGLLPRGPCRAARGGIGYVVGLGRIFFLKGIGSYLAGERQRVHGQASCSADVVVPRGRDLAVTHAVAKKEDDIPGSASLNLLLQPGHFRAAV